MKDLFAETDWSTTPLGPRVGWPQSLRTALNIIHAGALPAFIVAGTERTLLYNQPFAEILGDRHPLALGRPFFEVWPELREKLASVLNNTLRDESGCRQIVRFGEHRVFDLQIVPLIEDDHDSAVGLYCTCMELISAKACEAHQWEVLFETKEALRQSEKSYQTLFDSIDEGMCVIDVIFEDNTPVDYRFIEVNATFEAQTGLHDPIDKTARELVPDLDESWFQIYGEVARTGEPRRFENNAPAMGRWFDVYAFPFGPPKSNRIGLLFRDITEKIKAKERLRQNEKRFRLIADSAPAVLWMTDTDNACTFMNSGWTELTGQIEADALGDGWLERIHPEDHTYVLETFIEASRERKEFAYDFRLHTADGEYRWALVRGVARFDESGDYCGYIGSVIDIHDRKMNAQALKKAHEHQNQFMALLSHELRNPLAPIKLNLHLLEQLAPDSEKARLAREAIGRQTDQLTRLVDDLLDVTRITRDKIYLEPQELDLNQLLVHTVDDHRTLFEEKGLHLTLTPFDTPLIVEGDHNRLAQVIGNLLHNSVKFTNPGGKVSISVTTNASGDNAEITVSDTGVGLSPEILSTLFDPFIQADESLEHSSGGLGLGLALVKGLVGLHDGEISATSDGLGKGSEFKIRLPLIVPNTSATSVIDVAPPSSHDDGFQVVLIEDNPDIAQALEMILSMRGHDVRIATNGKDGLQITREVVPDFVFCDIGLPEMDGYAVASALRADDQFDSTYLVALSGYAMPEDIEKSKQSGFDEHFSKPPDLARIERLLNEFPKR